MIFLHFFYLQPFYKLLRYLPKSNKVFWESDLSSDGYEISMNDLNKVQKYSWVDNWKYFVFEVMEGYSFWSLRITKNRT